MGDADAAANLILKAAAYIHGHRPLKHWEEAVAAELNAARSTLDARVKELEGLLREAADELEAFDWPLKNATAAKIRSALTEKEPANG